MSWLFSSTFQAVQSLGVRDYLPTVVYLADDVEPEQMNTACSIGLRCECSQPRRVWRCIELGPLRPGTGIRFRLLTMKQVLVAASHRTSAGARFHPAPWQQRSHQTISQSLADAFSPKPEAPIAWENATGTFVRSILSVDSRSMRPSPWELTGEKIRGRPRRGLVEVLQ